MEHIAMPNGDDAKRPGHTHTAELPILKHREEILQLVGANPVTVVCGATGSGKSSQIPQMLYRDCISRGVTPLILCTQPRRIAAISLAKRVADEMGEPLGRTVGYMIGADRVVGRNTSIRFVTTGWAFEKLIHNDKFLTEVTHFVLDEVHERTIDADLLHLLIKMVLPKIPLEQRPKVILMSATFNASVFARYYAPENPPEPLFVGVNRYPVEAFFLEEFSNCPALRKLGNTGRSLEISEPKRLGVGGQANMLFLSVIRLLHDFHVERNEQCCVLVFLSGIAEIDALWEHIEESETADGATIELSDESLSFEDELADNVPKPGGSVAKKAVMSRFQLCMLHSSVEKEDQMTIFTEIPQGKTRIILSTNIAESSVTIPNARYVIDSGFHKHMAFDDRLGCTSLRTVPISLAAAKQRAGRTGRLFPGTVLRFYSERFASVMPEYDEPDMLRLPLFNTVLRLKVAAQEDLGFTSPLARPSDALGKAIDAPTRSQIRSAYGQLFKHGHMISGGTDDLDDSIVTPLGKFLQQLNVDIRLGSLVVTALVLFPDYLPHAIVMAVSMSLQNIFLHANSRTGSASLQNQLQFFDMISATERKRMGFNQDLFSDAMTALYAFGSQPNGPSAGSWAHRNGLHGTRLHQLHSQVMELAQRLQPLAPPHLIKDIQNLLSRNFTFSISKDDATILRFMLCYSLSDMLMIGVLQTAENKLSVPKNFGFSPSKVPYKDWRNCVFFQKVPMELLSMGGYFERVLCDTLFRVPHQLNFRIHVSAPKFHGQTQSYEASVAIEFDSEKDAVFAQVVFELCCKNGKFTVWINDEEKVVVSAPVARASLRMFVAHNGSNARIGGQSSVNYLAEGGTHFFIPGQTVFVGSAVIVEDVTWLSGSLEWVWHTVALTPASRVQSSQTIGMGVSEELEHSFKPADLRRLVYLKHLCHAATTSQFSPSGRIDLGVEICRSVLKIENLEKLSAPRLKAGFNKSISKSMPVATGAASVIVVCAPGSPTADAVAKLNVVQGLSLKGILSVAANKLLDKCGADNVSLRLARTNRIVSTEEILAECIASEGDAVGILHLDAVRKGQLVVTTKEHLPNQPLEAHSGLSRLALAASSSLPVDREDDDWLRSTMVEVLRVNGDGRCLVDQMWGSVKFMAKQPERITLERLVEVARTSPEVVEYNATRQFFCLAQNEDEEEDDELDDMFRFDGPAVLSVDEIPKSMWGNASSSIKAAPESKDKDKKKKALEKKKSSEAKGGKGKKKLPGPTILPSASAEERSVTKQFKTLGLGK